MKHLLSRDSLAIVALLAAERTLCAFDFDGTLAPIVTFPDRAAMRKRTRALMRELALLYPCIVVSGRAREDVLNKLTGVPVLRVIGNHGADTGDTSTARASVEHWKTTLEAGLASIPGLWIEDKGLSIAVHYRQCENRPRVRRRILAQAEALSCTRVFGGKQVVNIVADSAPNKGDALAEERDRLGLNWVLYVGDDENDESAFALEGNIVAVRIGCKLRSHASYYLRTQSEIDKLLEALIRHRRDLNSSK
jgi:trehalose 6-phosphate phosphatase